MTTAEIHTLTGAYVLDAVTDVERDVFAGHLGGCPTCAQEVLELQATAARLGSALAVTPHETLRTKVFAEIAVTRQLAPSTVDATVTAPTSRRWVRRIAAGVASMAAAAAVLVGGISIGAGHSDVPGMARAGNAILAAPDASTVTAYGVDGGSVTAVFSRVQGKVLLTAEALPPLDAAHSYQAWLNGPRGPQSAGLLHPGGHEPPVVAEIPADTTRITITTEPAAGSPQPTTAGVVGLDLR
jgi:hypothetical protein